MSEDGGRSSVDMGWRAKVETGRRPRIRTERRRDVDGGDGMEGEGRNWPPASEPDGAAASRSPEVGARSWTERWHLNPPREGPEPREEPRAERSGENKTIAL